MTRETYELLSPKASSRKKRYEKQPTEYWSLLSKILYTRNKEIILPLYKSHIRPHRLYADQFWSTHLRRDIHKIEKVQGRATEMIPESRNHNYHQRLNDQFVPSSLLKEDCEDI